VLLLGNSQLHALNQYKAGDQATSLLLFNKIKPRGLDLITFSYGNANIQEHSVLFTYLIDKLPIRTVLLSLVFDDTREDDVRQDVLDLLEDAEAQTTLRRFAIGRQFLESKVNGRATGTNAIGTKSSVQDVVEEKLDSSLSHWFAFWRLRGEVRYQIFKNLRSLRNRAFGITPSTVRKRIPAVYDKNMAAFEMLLSVARERNIRVLAYIAPIRQDLPLPYDHDEYVAFKKHVQTLAQTYGAAYADYDNLVPAEDWGLKDSTALSSQLEIDFMHFRTSGHHLLANRLENAIEQLQKGSN
jgi:hypothetical protein